MSWQAVLTYLHAWEGEYLSGEELNRQLGLGRTAMREAVDALRREGYTIEARTGLDYRLTASPDAHMEAEIRNRPGTAGLVRAQLKWPNGPVLHRKKFCGILTEMSLEAKTWRLQYLVLGLGLNVVRAADGTEKTVRSGGWLCPRNIRLCGVTKQGVFVCTARNER